MPASTHNGGTSSSLRGVNPGAAALAYLRAGGLPTKPPVAQERLRPADLVRKVLDFYPRQMEPLNGEKQPDPGSSPITWYDRHVHEKLLLKRVEKLPSLVPSIMKHADAVVNDFLDDVQELSATELLNPWNLGRHVSSAESITNLRASLVLPAMRLASIIALHPELPEIPPILYMIPDAKSKNVSPFFSQSLSIALFDVREPAKQASIASLPEHRKSLIDGLSEGRKPLVVWDTFALNGKDILNDMDKLAGAPFPWKLCPTVGHPMYASRDHPVVDAPKSLWTLPQAKSQTLDFLNACNLEGRKRLGDAGRDKLIWHPFDSSAEVGTADFMMRVSTNVNHQFIF